MNHRLQASGFFSHPFCANPSCGGEGLMEKRSSDPGEILSQPSRNPSPCTSVLSIPARSKRPSHSDCLHHFTPAVCNITAQEHLFPRTLLNHSQTAGPVPSLSASQDLYISTSGFACREFLALLQGPFANVNAFLALESSSVDLPEHISHASPKIMPFAFSGVQAEAEPCVPAACRESGESAVPGCGGNGARG